MKNNKYSRNDVNKTIKYLNVIALYDKNREPDYSKIYKTDVSWLENLRNN